MNSAGHFKLTEGLVCPDWRYEFLGKVVGKLILLIDHLGMKHWLRMGHVNSEF